MEKRSRVLICDDEPRMTASMREILVPEGYRVSCTNDSRHALTLIHAESPDLVILDIMMPGMTGFEVLDAINRERCDAAFIIVTGEASLDTAVQAIRKGANDYLKKPFEPEDLIIRVETALRQREINRDHVCVQAEKQQLENQLRQSQKMEAIGTLAGGIAHDFNNVLSIILGNAELALADTSAKAPVRQNLERILTASLRAREMIQQLLSFSRKEESGRKPLHLNRVVRESLKLLRASLPTNITIEMDISAKDCTAVADATQVHQVMLNLCTNAAHAMTPDGGELTVRLEPVVLQNASQVDNLAAGNYARLIVSDTGHGIEENVIERIFDPYFTTKDIDKGTGMGLSVVHGIVKSSGGAIKAFSKPGQYTEFHIYLPLVETAIADEATSLEHKQLPGGSEHILLVDDEAMLVDMMQQVLEQLGYRVSTHTKSEAALQAFAVQPQTYDLVITDMTMPGMNGTGLTKAIKELRQDIPVILCTGFNEQVNTDNIHALGIQALVMKPVGMQQLAETIRSVLMPKTAERRKAPRFTVPEGSFVISKANPYERCRLVDISPSGLAYRHEMEAPPANPSDQLAIMTPDGEVFISGLSCRIVSEISSPYGPAQTETERIRRSVCFENLSLLQMEQINQFIHTHTTQLPH